MDDIFMLACSFFFSRKVSQNPSSQPLDLTTFVSHMTNISTHMSHMEIMQKTIHHTNTMHTLYCDVITHLHCKPFFHLPPRSFPGRALDCHLQTSATSLATGSTFWSISPALGPSFSTNTPASTVPWCQRRQRGQAHWPCVFGGRCGRSLRGNMEEVRWYRDWRHALSVRWVEKEVACVWYFCSSLPGVLD